MSCIVCTLQLIRIYIKLNGNELFNKQNWVLIISIKDRAI